MSTNIYEEEVNSVLKKVSGGRNYWFIRTNSGIYFDEFQEKGFVAIGYNKVGLLEIKKAFDAEKLSKKAKTEADRNLKEHIKEVYPDETRPMYIGNQLIDFTYNVKKNDIVIIPSESSDYLLVGLVLETPIFELTNAEKTKCSHIRRKKITWIKLFKRHNMESNLLRIIYIHRTITKLDPTLGGFVERAINKVYVKDGLAHFTINVEKPDNIGAMSFISCWHSVFKLTEEFGNEIGIDVEVEEIDFKLNLNSPGPIEFISMGISGIALLAIVTALIVGVDLDLNIRVVKLSVRTPGLLDKWREYKNHEIRRKLVDDSHSKLLDMNVSKDQLVDIIKTLSEHNRHGNDPKKENP